jgi:hypothetical protein
MGKHPLIADFSQKEYELECKQYVTANIPL